MCMSKIVKSKGIDLEAKGNESVRHLQKFHEKCLRSSFLLPPPHPQSVPCPVFKDFFEHKSWQRPLWPFQISVVWDFLHEFTMRLYLYNTNYFPFSITSLNFYWILSYLRRKTPSSFKSGNLHTLILRYTLLLDMW